jgi:hypothetical protein
MPRRGVGFITAGRRRPVGVPARSAITSKAVVELATGRVVATVPDQGLTYWPTNATMLVVTATGVSHVSIDGTRLAQFPRPRWVGAQSWQMDASLIPE